MVTLGEGIFAAAVAVVGWKFWQSRKNAKAKGMEVKGVWTKPWKGLER